MEYLFAAAVVGLIVLAGLPEARARRALAPAHAAVATTAISGFGSGRYVFLFLLLAAGVVISRVNGLTGTTADVASIAIPLGTYFTALSGVSIAKLRRGRAPRSYLRAFLVSTALELTVLVGALVLAIVK